MNSVEGHLDAVLVAASGCGHTMKAYGELLTGNVQFRAPVLDVQEFLADRGLTGDLPQPTATPARRGGHA